MYPFRCLVGPQVVLGAAPGATNPYSKLGTPMVVAGLVLTSAGTIVFPAILAYLCNQVGVSYDFYGVYCCFCCIFTTPYLLLAL